MRTRNRLFIVTTVVLLVFTVNSQSLSQTKKVCGNAPDLISKPRLSPEDAAKIKSSLLRGRVVALVDEHGTVTGAKVMSADPKEGADILHDAVMAARFKERPGCAPFRIDFFFNIGNR